MTTCGRSRKAILIFARAPVPGEAKTRLIPALGAGGAARLQHRLTEHALATATRASPDSIQLWCTPDRAHPFFAECARRHPILLKTQSGATLGERLAFAVVGELHSHDAVVVIGTDCPVLTHENLRFALDALDAHDAVIHPAEDGGYVLIGLSQAFAQAFDDVDWSSDRVFDKTMQNFLRGQLRVAVHETLWDVDTPADLARLTRTMPEWAKVVDPAGNR
jgi:rSAM/selenodomain-associated transferase 1